MNYTESISIILMSQMQPEVGVFLFSKIEKKALMAGDHKNCSILLFTSVFSVDLSLKHIG